ncbi:PilW family protein [Cupriavidus metallidurans]|uniref:Type IV fimbrial biogenesis pilW-related transmembrane protein n=1 Tax=Cupriavidus metallidurans (strain ATCC 43123 / DSM 2839 / NBRC 102507 / CH34) TaxID=266264 RepID=Q1LBD0_CUPMC|nr:PilW family protein [Cupriavidus metallidurans]ABF12546.1 Type IV fimbrial biogenesis pilW-related transmembrane protein [Cupriavidus metallidurans CH34]QGS32243.1 prepilin-type N-terminal cleavage/methylation domain-containing protein [Cupriavidus metallidurans]
MTRAHHAAVLHLRSRQRGFSLVELMVAITLTLIILTALSALYLNTSTTRNEFANSADQMENGRYVLDTMTRELELAGFFGPTNLSTKALVSSPDVCATDPSALGFSGSPVTMPLGVQGFAPGTIAPCLSNLLASSEILVVRRVSTTPVSAAVTGTPYLQASFCASDTSQMVFGASAAQFTLRTKTCDNTVPSALRQATVRIYYLAGCDQCGGSGDGVPTLKMAELSNGAFQIQSVAVGIQDMHLIYGVDLDSNGSPDCYVADPGSNNAAQCTTVTTYDWSVPLTNWKNVTAIRIGVLARTSRKTNGWTDTRTYDLGRAQAAGPFNDGYKRHIYAQTARLINVAGNRE